MTTNFVVTSALCIIPPSNVWDGIQKIRKVHDKSYDRWPPHINLIYPFIHNNDLPKYINQIRDCLIDVKPFMVNMKEFKHFSHKNYNTVWLHPEQDDEIKDVHAKISEKFKDPKKPNSHSFCPHLSVGQASSQETSKKMDMFSSDFDEITFEVNSVQIITRNGNKPFEVRYTVPFGGGDVTHENVTVFPV